MLPVVTRSSLEKGESKEIFEAFKELAASLEPSLRIEVVKNLVVINLLDGVLWVLPNYELTSCFRDTLDRIKDETRRELGDMSRMVYLFL